MKNLEYTNSWISTKFDEDEVKRYDAKFYSRFEKNIKHKQQIRLIKKYLNPNMKWIDAPIGSGRLMDNIDHPKINSYGFDLSDSFLEYNRKKGIHCIKGDLSKIDLQERFDLVTSLHTIFAFNDFKTILSNYIKILNEGGYLIVDIVNLQVFDNFSTSKIIDNSVDINGMKREEVYAFFNNLNCDVLEIIPHDYYDSHKVLFWRNSGGTITRKLKKLSWNILNVLYFKLKLFDLFELFEKKDRIDLFNKFLVVVKKNTYHI